jgi:hypothetical protein
MRAHKQAPEIVALYALNVSPSSIRIKIRQDFERNRNIQDLQIIDMLLHKNQQEYQETMNCWKQEVRFEPAISVHAGFHRKDSSLCHLRGKKWVQGGEEQAHSWAASRCTGTAIVYGRRCGGYSEFGEA